MLCTQPLSLKLSVFIVPTNRENSRVPTCENFLFFQHVVLRFVFAHETRAWMNEQPNSGVRGALSGDHLPYILGYPLSNMEKEDKVSNFQLLFIIYSAVRWF